MFDMSSDDDYDQNKGKASIAKTSKPTLLEDSDDDEDTFKPAAKPKNAPAQNKKLSMLDSDESEEEKPVQKK